MLRVWLVLDRASRLWFSYLGRAVGEGCDGITRMGLGATSWMSFEELTPSDEHGRGRSGRPLVSREW